MICHHTLKSEVTVVSYADDITLLCTSACLVDAGTYMQQYLDSLSQWLVKWKFLLNPAKSTMQVFTKKRIIPPIILKIDQNNLSNRPTQRVLGVIFDSPKLTFSAHIAKVKEDCERRIQVIRALSSTKWGCSRNILRTIYISYIRTKLEYGCVLFGELSDKNLRKLEVLQNRALRCILGARKTSPILSLEIEAHIPPINLRFRYICAKWCSKVLNCSENNKGSLAQSVSLLEQDSHYNLVYREVSTLLRVKGLIKRTVTPSLSPVPPWFDIGARVRLYIYTF